MRSAKLTSKAGLGAEALVRTDQPLERLITTPEGVALRLELASGGYRIAAFLLDMTFVLTVAVALSALSLLAAMGDFFSWFVAFWILAIFVLRNFYFFFFELRWGGRTPGKRICRIRVVDRQGRPLTAGALFVRNVTRDLELFLPLAALAAPAQLWPGAPVIARLVCAVWLLIIAAMPLLNRDLLRLGDFLAGTMVVRDPKHELQAEVYDRGEETQTFEFTDAQLDMYGIYELQVLEDVLRRDVKKSVKRQIAGRIARKIGYQGDGWSWHPRAFLESFYRALRERREKKLLFGERQERKRDGKLDG